MLVSIASRDNSTWKVVEAVQERPAAALELTHSSFTDILAAATCSSYGMIDDTY